MSKVNIAKLLKTKNRIASEITRVKAKIQLHNTYTVEKGKEETSTPQVNVLDLGKDLMSLTEKLIAVKAAINSANSKSSEKIYKLSETKGLISYYSALNCVEGKDRYGYGENAEVTVAQIKIPVRDQIVSDLIKLANALQDELDEFNAIHKVEIDDDLLL